MSDPTGDRVNQAKTGRSERPLETKLGESGWRVLPYIALGWGPLQTSILRPSAQPTIRKGSREDESKIPRYDDRDTLQCGKNAFLASFNHVQRLNSRHEPADLLTFDELEEIDQMTPRKNTAKAGLKSAQEEYSSFKDHLDSDGRVIYLDHIEDMKHDVEGINNFTARRLMQWLELLNNRKGTSYVLGRVSAGHDTRGKPTNPGASIDSEVLGHAVVWVAHNGRQDELAHWEAIGPYDDLSPGSQEAQRKVLWGWNLWERAKELVEHGVYRLLEDYTTAEHGTLHRGNFVKDFAGVEDRPGFRIVLNRDGDKGDIVELPLSVLERVTMRDVDPAIAPASTPSKSDQLGPQTLKGPPPSKDNVPSPPKTPSGALAKPDSMFGSQYSDIRHQQPEDQRGHGAADFSANRAAKDTFGAAMQGASSPPSPESLFNTTFGDISSLQSPVTSSLVPFRVFRTIEATCRNGDLYGDDSLNLRYSTALPIGSLLLDTLRRVGSSNDVLEQFRGCFETRDLVAMTDQAPRIRSRELERISKAEIRASRERWVERCIHPRILQRLESPWGLPSHLPIKSSSRVYLPLATVLEYIPPCEDHRGQHHVALERNEVVLVMGPQHVMHGNLGIGQVWVRTYDRETVAVSEALLEYIHRPFDLPIDHENFASSALWERIYSIGFSGPVEEKSQIELEEEAPAIREDEAPTAPEFIAVTTSATQTSDSLPPSPASVMESTRKSPTPALGKRKVPASSGIEPLFKRVTRSNKPDHQAPKRGSEPRQVSEPKEESETKSGESNTQLLVPRVIKDKGKDSKGKVQYLVSFGIGGGKGKAIDRRTSSQDESIKKGNGKKLVMAYNATVKLDSTASDEKKSGKKGVLKLEPKKEPKPKAGKRALDTSETRETRSSKRKRKEEDDESEVNRGPAPKRGKQISVTRSDSKPAPEKFKKLPGSTQKKSAKKTKAASIASQKTIKKARGDEDPVTAAAEIEDENSEEKANEPSGDEQVEDVSAVELSSFANEEGGSTSDSNHDRLDTIMEVTEPFSDGV